MIVYFNGRYLPKEEVGISPDDRGFLFADGVYEVVRTYHRRLFALDAHIARLTASLADLRIHYPQVQGLGEVAERLLRENTVGTPEVRVYIQITRGVAARNHGFPAPGTPPTVYACPQTLTPAARLQAEGIAAITASDSRWGRCDIKSLALLPNVLVYQRALEAGAQEAVLVRDGVVTEGSHNSVFAVLDGTITTAPLSNLILPGITRAVILGLCAGAGIPVREHAVPESRLPEASELFVAGTTAEVTPVTRLNGRNVGDGEPGPVTRRLQNLFREMVAALPGAPRVA